VSTTVKTEHLVSTYKAAGQPEGTVTRYCSPSGYQPDDELVILS
jgi:hypothetical protein